MVTDRDLRGPPRGRCVVHCRYVEIGHCHWSPEVTRKGPMVTRSHQMVTFREDLVTNRAHTRRRGDDHGRLILVEMLAFDVSLNLARHPALTRLSALALLTLSVRVLSELLPAAGVVTPPLFLLDILCLV